MKICQIVAYVSRDGAYGGPTTVAFAQCQALAAGNDVTLAAGSDGLVEPRHGDGVRRIYRKAYRPLRSFGSLLSPSLLGWFLRNARSFDVVHIHLGRDLLVMPMALACRLLRVPYVVQTHGMVRFDGGTGQRLYDALLTRGVLRGARRSFILTREESRDLATVPGHPPLQELRNAVPTPAPLAFAAASTVAGRPHRPDPAGPEPTGPGQPFEVLFCSRLHSRKRPELFVAAARALDARHPGRFRFRVVGPDGGGLAAVTEAVDGFPGGNFSYDGAVAPEDVAGLLDAADVLMLPSINEPFPMVVLEALSRGLPVIIDETCGLAPIIGGRPGARVVDAGERTLASAVVSIMESPVDEAQAAREIAAVEFSIARLEQELMTAYGEVVA